MRSFSDIPYVENGSNMQLLDIFLPDSDGFDTLIWFHGGGLHAGSRKNPEYAETVTSKGCAFVSVEYRMYPDARFPDFLEDAAAAVAYTLNRLPAMGGTGKVFVSGASAGAYITMMLCMDHHYLADAGVKQEQIAGFISDSAQQCDHFKVMQELGMDGRLVRVSHISAMITFPSGLQG